MNSTAIILIVLIATAVLADLRWKQQKKTYKKLYPRKSWTPPTLACWTSCLCWTLAIMIPFLTIEGVL